MAGWLVLACVAAAAAGQDFAKPRSELRSAIEDANAIAAREVIESVVTAQSRGAVDVLLWGIGLTKKTEAGFEGQRPGLEDRLGALRKVYDDAARAYQAAARDAMLDPTSKKKADKAAQEKARALEARDAVNAASAELRTLEQKIRNTGSIRSQLLNALWRMEGEEAVAGLASQLAAHSDWLVRAGIAAALERLDRTGVLEALLAAVETEKEPTVRVAIIDAIAAKGQKTEAVVRTLAGLLKTDVWQAAYAALRGLVALGAREAIDAILDAMDSAEGRLKYDFQAALIALTGVDKGIASAAWRAWFEQHRDAILAGTYEPRPDEMPGKAGGMTMFFGLPVTSNRVVFVLDRSGSMAQPADWVPEVGTGEELPKELREPAGKRKIDVARWQLKKVLYLMPKGAWFNIVFYNGEFQIFKDRLVKLSDKTREEAYKFIDDLQPDGSTNVFDSLERGLQFAMGKDGKLDKDGADTIYLLSDGLPNQGKHTRPEDILREIASMNDRLKVAINTVWVGGRGGIRIGSRSGSDRKDPGEEFMEKLAGENHGKSVSSRR